jgi:hypothetical protein
MNDCIQNYLLTGNIIVVIYIMLFSITLILFLPYGFQTKSIDSQQIKLPLVNNFAFKIFNLLSINYKNEVTYLISPLSGFNKKPKNI